MNGYRKIIASLAKTYAQEVVVDNKIVDVKTCRVADVSRSDYPDFSDAFIEEALFVDGTPLTDDELQQLNENNGDLINELAHKSLY